MSTPPERRPVAELTTVDGQPLLGPLARRAARWFADGVHAEFAADGGSTLTMSQAGLLSVLDRGGTSIAELARRCDVTRQTAHRLVHDLVAENLVELVADPASSRRRLVRPTRQGHRHLLTAQLALVRLEDVLIERLGEDAVAVLRDVLGRDWGPAGPA